MRKSNPALSSTSIAVIALLVFSHSSCNTKTGANDSAAPPTASVEDTTQGEMVANDDYTSEESAVPDHNLIHYRGAESDPIKSQLETFPPFAKIHELARRSIDLKDSLEIKNQYEPAALLDDSAIFRPAEIEAYQAILEYKKMMASRSKPEPEAPGLIYLTRNVEAGDSSPSYLPEVEASVFFSRGNFFFLGGAPFISRINPPENSLFTDPEGQPEVRFATSVTENANYFPTSILSYATGAIAIEFGPPLDSYEMGPQEVQGIGSLIHRFLNRLPVFFITDRGWIQGHLISFELKLVPQGLGCVSDQPRITFACAENISADDILAVYIPYSGFQPGVCTVSRRPDRVWTADLDGDGTADLACVSGAFEGISSDTMAQRLWFVNLEGTWKIIDFAEELDCT